jgi:poly [ADP-ribose] polymerase
MDEEKPEVFTVSVGNLPPRCDALIKITYVTELEVDGDNIVFRLPASVSAQQQKSATAQITQTTTESVNVEATDAKFGLQVTPFYNNIFLK